MVLGEKDVSRVTALLGDVVAHPKLLAQPQRHRLQERAKARWSEIKIGLKQTLERLKRFVVVGDVIELRALDASFTQAIGNGIGGEAIVVLLAAEALFLGSGNDFAVPHQTGRRIVIIRRNSEDVHR